MNRLAAVLTLPLIAVLTLSAFTGAQGTSGTETPTPSPSAVPLQTGADGPVTDYTNKTNWLHTPKKITKDVDVFYVYPTAYSKPDASSPDIAAVTDPGMRKGAAAAYDRQATAFTDVANVYAPYYRQADATYALTLPQDQHVQVIEGAPLIDVTAAFDYYIKNYNNGRPFIIVAHSQGSDVTTHLLSTYMKDHPKVYARMIAAYIPGYSVTPEYLAANPHLKFGKSATDTGVILSWNTEAPTIDGTNPVLLPGALAINPITWTTNTTTAPASKSRGAWLPGKNGVYAKVPHYADATIDPVKGVIITTTPDVNTWSPGGPGQFPKGVFHSFDFPFYFYDVQKNAKQRVAVWMKTH